MNFEMQNIPLSTPWRDLVFDPNSRCKCAIGPKTSFVSNTCVLVAASPNLGPNPGCKQAGEETASVGHHVLTYRMDVLKGNSKDLLLLGHVQFESVPRVNEECV